jgi:hypothetical protein
MNPDILKKGDRLFPIPGKVQSNYQTLTNLEEVAFECIGNGRGWNTYLITVKIKKGSSYNKESYMGSSDGQMILVNPNAFSQYQQGALKQESCELWW